MEKLYMRTEDPAVRFISDSDPLMEQLIAAVGNFEITLRTDYLPSIVRSIVGQQISVSAATAIYKRLEELLGGEVTAERLLRTTEEQLHQAGLTKRKAAYVKDLAEKIDRGELDLDHISDYDDRSVVEQLVNVKGIGNWTAEMFLLLSLGRRDVLAVDDVGIQRAAAWLYGVEKTERRAILVEKSPIWKPHRSIASFYLWEAIHLGLTSDYRSIADYDHAARGYER